MNQSVVTATSEATIRPVPASDREAGPVGTDAERSAVSFAVSYLTCRSHLRPGRYASRGLVAFVALAVTVLVPSSVAAQALGSLVGIVRTLSGEPIEGITVTVTGDEQTVSGTTDEDGEYEIEGLLPGLVGITVENTDLVLLPELVVGVVSNITIRSDLILRSLDEVAMRRWDAAEFVEASPGLAAVQFDGDELEAGVLPLSSYLERVPGVTVAREGGIGQPTSLVVRGVEVTDRFLVTDGTPLEGTVQRLHGGDGQATEELEVVRGLPSSRRDGDMTGIVHRLIKPTGDPATPTVSASAEAGDYGWQQFGASASGSGGAFDWHVGAQHAEADNEQPNSDYRRTALSGSLDFTGRLITSHLMFQGEMSEVGRSGPTLLVRPDLDARQERTRFAGAGTFRLTRGRRSFHELRLVGTQSDIRSLNPLDSGAMLLQSSVEAARLVSVPDLARAGGYRNDLRTGRVSYEYVFEIDEFHYMTFGGTAEGESGRFTRTNLFDQTRANLSLYAEDRIQLFPDLLLTAGGRFVKNGPFGFRAMPRGSLIYELGWGFSARAGGGYGVGTPTLTQRFGESFLWQGNPDLEQARSRNVDAGIIGSIWGNRLRIEASGYWHQYDDLIVLGELEVPRLETLASYRRLTLAERLQLESDVLAGIRQPLVVSADDPRVSFVNLPISRAIGAEVSIIAAPVSQVMLHGTYSYADSEVRRGTRLFRPGDPMPGMPEHQGTFTADVRVGRVSVGGTLRYVGERTSPLDYVSHVLGVQTLGSYTRYDVRARVGLTDGLWLSVVGENVTDEQYQESLGYPALGRLLRAGVQVAF